MQERRGSVQKRAAPDQSRAPLPDARCGSRQQPLYNKRMNRRKFSFADRLIGEIDKAIKVLGAPAKSSREVPFAAGDLPGLAPDQAARSVRLMRVNHAGEVAAQALYQGQALTARNPQIVAAMQNAAAEETDHLAWCERRLAELGGRTSVLNPLWYAGSYAIGAMAGAFGDRVSLGFVAETEKQVESHLHEHLGRLPEADARSRAILTQMQHDEIAHGAKASSLGAVTLPAALQAAMRLSSRLMTRSSFWL
jgi:ubiquinone biosynthesis monooxygenase Coq7